MRVIVAAVVLALVGTAHAAPKPGVSVTPRNVSYAPYGPGSGAVLDFTLKPCGRFTIDITLDGTHQAFRQNSCAMTKSCDAVVSKVRGQGGAWDYKAYSCAKWPSEGLFSILDPPIESEEGYVHTSLLRVVVTKAQRAVFRGAFDITYRFKPNADTTRTITESEFDDFINICINGNYTLKSANGELYCIVVDEEPAMYISISKR